jgi:hypothetical protein
MRRQTAAPRRGGAWGSYALLASGSSVRFGQARIGHSAPCLTPRSHAGKALRVTRRTMHRLTRLSIPAAAAPRHPARRKRTRRELRPRRRAGSRPRTARTPRRGLKAADNRLSDERAPAAGSTAGRELLVGNDFGVPELSPVRKPATSKEMKQARRRPPPRCRRGSPRPPFPVMRHRTSSRRSWIRSDPRPSRATDPHASVHPRATS